MMRVKKVVGIDRPSPDWVFWLLKNAGTTIPKSLFTFNTLFPLPPFILKIPCFGPEARVNLADKINIFIADFRFRGLDFFCFPIQSAFRNRQSEISEPCPESLDNEARKQYNFFPGIAFPNVVLNCQYMDSPTPYKETGKEIGNGTEKSDHSYLTGKEAEKRDDCLAYGL
jgi:hypothetical protein